MRKHTQSARGSRPPRRASRATRRETPPRARRQPPPRAAPVPPCPSCRAGSATRCSSLRRWPAATRARHSTASRRPGGARRGRLRYGKACRWLVPGRQRWGGRRRTSARAGAGLTRAWPLDLLQPVRPCGREGGHSGARGAFRQGKDPWRAWGGVDGRGRARGWHAALPSLRGVWAYALCAQEAASAVQHAARRGARACSSRDRCSRSAIAAHPVRSTRAHRAAGGGVCILRSPRPNNRRCCSHLPR